MVKIFKPLVFGLIISLLAGVPLGIYLTDTTPPKDHYPLYKEIYEIKDRIQIKITEPNFTNPERTCEWYELGKKIAGTISKPPSISGCSKQDKKNTAT